MNPKDHEGWNNMANSYNGKGDTAKAIECWKKALEIKADKYETWYNLGIKYKELGQFDLAIECCQKILERYPDSYEVKRLLDAINEEKESV